MDAASKAELARLVHKFTLSEVLHTLVEICEQRAHNLQSRHNDASAAGLWEAAARRITQALNLIRI